MSDLHRDIKMLIIDALGLEDISAEDIGDDQTLFGEGLGLDSVDALELGLAIQKKIRHQNRRRRQGHAQSLQ
jgi:acyl carrier protein